MRLSKRKKRPFTQVDNKPLNEQMSFQAKGLLVYLLSKPDDWEIRTNQLINQSGEKETKSGKVIPKNGRDAIRSMFAELIEFGYARIENNKDETGRFIGKIYRITEVAFCFEDESATEDGISGDGKTDAGKTDAGKTPYIVSTEKNQVLKETNTESSSLPPARKISRTDSGSIDVASLKPSEPTMAEKNPPVPAAPPTDSDSFDLHQEIRSKVNIRRFVESWAMQQKVSTAQVESAIDRWIPSFISRKCDGMTDEEIELWAKRTGSRAFTSAFQSSKFLTDIHRDISTSNHQPHAKSQQARNSEPSRRKSQRELLADLYPDVAAELYGDLASGVDGRNPEPASHAHWREA